MAATARIAAAGATGEAPEVGVRALTTAVYSLPHRPPIGSIEGYLLDRWARLDASLRDQTVGAGDEEDSKRALHDLIDACGRAADANSLLALRAVGDMAARGDNERVLIALDHLGLAVYRRAYRREPPPGAYPRCPR